MDKYTETSKKIVLVLRRTSQAIAKHSRSLTYIYGINGLQLSLLKEIKNNKGITIVELSNLSSFSQPTVSTNIDFLEAQGLLERQRDIQDTVFLVNT